MGMRRTRPCRGQMLVDLQRRQRAEFPGVVRLAELLQPGAVKSDRGRRAVTLIPGNERLNDFALTIDPVSGPIRELARILGECGYGA